MKAVNIKNGIYSGSRNRQSLYDLVIPDNWNGKTIIFLHGYMGYKDWGAWHLMQDYFVELGYGFVKFNISHNGGTIDQGIDFPDLDAFSINTYTSELEDLEKLIEHLQNYYRELEKFNIIGHSRGGGMAVLHSKHPSVEKIISLAPIASIEERLRAYGLEEWQKNGVAYRLNSRTHQQMPHSFEQWLDFESNSEHLNIETYAKTCQKPLLIIHGNADQSVSIEDGRKISNWANCPLIEIDGADHTFGSSQPWTKNELPSHLEQACKHLLDFLSNE